MQFERDIRPIFEEHCYKCHGPQESKAGLRLSNRREGLGPTDSGTPAIVPGDAGASHLIHRVTSTNPKERMPKDAPPLDESQVASLRAWIAQGAEWPADTSQPLHWAYVKPERAPLPTVSSSDWPVNVVDRFVLARLDEEGLKPSAPADRATLLRRVYLDLIGLPPSPADIHAFLNDSSPQAYLRVVEKLLASPAYGEKWARPWLDLARYADSNGYQRDGFRDLWPYRDWVVRAINADMPFDQFTVEQLAGDLLPDATLDQKIATGFHRSVTVNVEAGTDPEEDRIKQVVDRVNTTATVFLGTTMECAQCHNHKYDPFTQLEYYRLFAYFNNTPIESRRQGPATLQFDGPQLAMPLEAEQRTVLARLQKQMKESQERLAKINAELKDPKASDTPQDGQPADPAQLRRQVAALQEKVKQLTHRIQRATPHTQVMTELPEPRQTFLMKRGSHLDPGPQVQPGVPQVLHPLPSEAPPNRLGLARWLTHPDNPLIGRVTVNRWWAEFFGYGLVATLEDFGLQSEPPTHPQLLDWLAVEFVESGWSMKHIHRLIVTSAMYQQDSRVTPALLAADPVNKLYARGPRVRLAAEIIRDQALAAAGLLSRNVGGPPVYPPQPEGVWRVTGFVDNTYYTSGGQDAMRRGLYTIWRRSSPYPSFVTFDAPDRASCVVQRPRTNTPLQALTLMNDPVYVETAVALAARLLDEQPAATDERRLDYACELLLGRPPRPEERHHLLGVVTRQRERYRGDPSAADALLDRTPPANGSDKIELAAWFHVATILLNLDETVTKR